MPSIAYIEAEDDLVVFVCGNTPWTESEWVEYVRYVEPRAERARATGQPLNFVVFAADEGAPNAKQRAALVEALHGVSTRTAVVTNSVVARHIITAFGWLGVNQRGFSPTMIGAAAIYLGLSPPRLTTVLSKAASLATPVGGSPCLEVALSASQRSLSR